MARGSLSPLCALAAMLAATACSPVAYVPRPLDPASNAAQFQARSLRSDGLKSFAQANGYLLPTWPPEQWGLRELTLIALYFNPGIDLARSRADVAHAESRSAVQPQSWSGRVKPEYHSRNPPDTRGPWTLGLELEIPLVAQSKRAARAERSAFLADAADLDIASAAWQARSGVRDHYLALRASRDGLTLLDAQIEARDQMLGLVERRVQAGMLSAHDLAVERFAHAQFVQARSQALATQQRLRSELAAVLGLPAETLDAMTLNFDAPVPPIDLEAAEVRRLALRNRLDVHRKLLEFGAADADVKAAVAAQNPEITLGPGYTWDQGDNLWSLAVGLSLPSAARTQAAILEAQARRELGAEHFAVTQFAAIGLAARASGLYRLARERVSAAAQSWQMQREQESRINRQFDSGTADRMQRLAARLETLAAESLLQAALVAQSQALAELEDALQRPLFGDFDVLPEPPGRRGADLSGRLARATGAPALAPWAMAP